MAVLGLLGAVGDNTPLVRVKPLTPKRVALVAGPGKGECLWKAAREVELAKGAPGSEPPVLGGSRRGGALTRVELGLSPVGGLGWGSRRC